MCDEQKLYSDDYITIGQLNKLKGGNMNKKNKGESFETEIEQSCTLCDGTGFDCDERCDDCNGSGETTSLADFEWCDETNNYICDWYGEYDLEEKNDS